jgi:hypothetical protein
MNNVNKDENGFYIPAGEIPLVENSSSIGFNGGRNNSIKPFNGYELREVLPIDATLAEDSDPYQNAIGVGRKGRVAGRKAKREAKKSGASNKEARAAKKTTKAGYAKEDSRRKDVLERRAEKLTVKATTKFGSEERKSGIKEVREAARKTLNKGIKAINVPAKNEYADVDEDELDEDVLDEGEDTATDPSKRMMDDDGSNGADGTSDWSTYLVYGGIGVGVLLVIGVLFLSGGSKTTTAPAA